MSHKSVTQKAWVSLGECHGSIGSDHVQNPGRISFNNPEIARLMVISSQISASTLYLEVLNVLWKENKKLLNNKQIGKLQVL